MITFEVKRAFRMFYGVKPLRSIVYISIFNLFIRYHSVCFLSLTPFCFVIMGKNYQPFFITDNCQLKNSIIRIQDNYVNVTTYVALASFSMINYWESLQ